MSGHSKWAQIKHKKAITDAKRGRLFSKISREITVAAKLGGNGPDAGSRLRAAIERAHAVGLSKEAIERAVQKADKSAGGENPQEYIYEALGPGGVSMLIEVVTDNKNRSLSEIKLVLSGKGAKLTDPGSLLWNFEKTGVLEIDEETNAPKGKDEVESAIIESGAIDFEAYDGGWLIYTDFSATEKVRKLLERSGVKIRRSGHTYRPKNKMTVGEENRVYLDDLADKLLDQDDVQDVYTNLADE